MLTSGDLYRANDKQFLDAHPEKKAELIDHIKRHKPGECRECLFFKWIASEGRALKAYCAAADDEIKPSVTQRAIYCPLDADDHAGPER